MATRVFAKWYSNKVVLEQVHDEFVRVPNSQFLGYLIDGYIRDIPLDGLRNTAGVTIDTLTSHIAEQSNKVFDYLSSDYVIAWKGDPGIKYVLFRIDGNWLYCEVTKTDDSVDSVVRILSFDEIKDLLLYFITNFYLKVSVASIGIRNYVENAKLIANRR